MNRNRGLLALVCTLIALACALFQVPIVSGLVWLGHSLSQPLPEDLPPLAIALSPADTPQLPRGPGQAQPVTLVEMRWDQRADPEVRRLADKYRLPFTLLKSHLAFASCGVAAADGMFWPRLPAGEDDSRLKKQPGEALARTRAAAAVLARYRRETGSIAGALTAWKIGVVRSLHALGGIGRGIEEVTDALRRRLPAFDFNAARRYLCSVWGLSLALEARWPAQNLRASPQAGTKDGGVSLSVPAGGAIVAPMAGSVGWIGHNGRQGLCVEIVHGCELRTTLCGLAEVLVRPGKRLQPGSIVGRAAPGGTWFGLDLGSYHLDPRVLRAGPRDD